MDTYNSIIIHVQAQRYLKISRINIQHAPAQGKLTLPKNFRRPGISKGDESLKNFINVDLLANQKFKRLEHLPLFITLPPQEQRRYDPHGGISTEKEASDQYNS